MGRSLVLRIVAAACLLSVPHSIATQAGASAGYREGRVIVRLSDRPRVQGGQTGLPEVDSVLREYGVRRIEPAFRPDWSRNADLKRRFGFDRMLFLEFPPAVPVEHVAARLSAIKGVEYAEPDRIGRGGQVPPDDTHYPDQWHLENAGQSGGTEGADIDAEAGWSRSTGSPAVVVAVLDTGIDSAHPEFAGRIVPGYDFVNDDPDPEADHSHGTYVAGIILANANNSFQVAGIDWNAALMPVKVLNDQNLGFTSDLVDGIIFATDNGADVINMSLINYPCSGSLKNALAYARNAGVVPVASAGNNGPGDADVSGPGCISESISIGATDHDDARASFSATGSALDLVAPGNGVRTVRYHDYGDGFTSFSGTSAAAPVASGVCALARAISPTLVPDEIQALLESNADDGVGPASEDVPGRDDSFGWGRLDMSETLAAVFPEPLRKGEVRPERIGVGGTATFTVIHSSAAGTPPDFVRLHLGGLEPGVHDMAPSSVAHPSLRDGDPTNGEQYEVALVLGTPGDYSFHFEAEDLGVPARHPTAGELPGPAVGLIVADDVAIAETPLESTVVFQDFTATHFLDNWSEGVEEVSSNGSPSRRYSTLDHRYEFDVTGSDTVTFHLNAERLIFWPAEDDRYDFFYSTDGGAGWTFMFNVSTTDAGSGYQTFEMPPGTSGQVLVRVEDTDSTEGNDGNDRVFIDHMFFRSEAAPPASTPGEALSLSVGDYDHVAGKLTLAYGPACAATGHNVVYGPLQDVGTYGYTGQDCNIGITGLYDQFDPGAGSWFFLVVATGDTGIEGSYGLDGTGSERPEQTGDPVCPATQDLSLRCDR